MKKIKNLIFDFGGVLYDIDILSTLKRFEKIGFRPDKMSGRFSDMLGKFETGLITEDKFLDYLVSEAYTGTKREVVKDIFMKVLTGLNMESFYFLLSCRKNYNLFLLSNTSSLHYEYFHAEILANPETSEFYNCFIKEFYSFQLVMRKPDTRIFQYVIADSGVVPEETLFIDDNEENVLAAVKCGLNGFVFGAEGKINELCRKFDLEV